MINEEKMMSNVSLTKLWLDPINGDPLIPRPPEDVFSPPDDIFVPQVHEAMLYRLTSSLAST